MMQLLSILLSSSSYSIAAWWKKDYDYAARRDLQKAELRCGLKFALK
jgi:hypothetical protein